MNMKRLTFLTIITVALASCIENDIPMPTIQAVFTAFEVEGAARAPKINNQLQTVTVYLDELTDPRSVKVDSVAYNEGEPVRSSVDFAQRLNLCSPLAVTLTLYQDYQWNIRSEQEIERYFEVEGQIGDADIDYINHRVVTLVTAATDIRNIKVKRAKLGPANLTTESPAIGSITDFSTEQKVEISYYGKKEQWTIYVVNSTSSIEMKSADAWTRVAWLEANGVAGADNGFKYRAKGTEEWTDLPDEQITASSSGSFKGLIKGLQPLSEYEYYAYCNDEMTEVGSFTTEAEVALPNGSFDDWHQDGKVWNPWAMGGTKFWDTGNKGAASVGASNSVPTADGCPANPTGQAAFLETKYIVIKLAAGNLYVGDYVKTDGTNGIIDMGREWTTRPTKLRGWYKYQPQPMNIVSDELAHLNLKGKNDTCNIYMLLGDWDAPVQVRTNPRNRKLIDFNDPNIIAMAQLQSGDVVTEYKQFELEFEYRSTSRKPKYLICVISASKYGDYFTGGDGSLLTVDEFEFDYDY